LGEPNSRWRHDYCKKYSYPTKCKENLSLSKVYDPESEGAAPLNLDVRTRWEVDSQILIPADSVLIKGPKINTEQKAGWAPGAI